MYITSFKAEAQTASQRPLGVSIVMPCLNEAVSLPHCIRNARAALELVDAKFGLAGEIVIADNGSTDGSQEIAIAMGARVVAVARRGYGAAIIGGAEAALGDYLLIGDADGSYDFTDGVEMIARLVEGADICMGSRFAGGIAKGAMPWKNRYIGNPLLTGLLNLLFKTGISDAHCGLRAITRNSFNALRLSGDGMEFASEMLVKASLKKIRIAESPATLSPDLRDRAPHLRPWRDGWRHLRYLFMLSPTGLFAIPGIVGALFSGGLLVAGASDFFFPGTFPAIGNYWVVLASALFALSHLAGLLAVSSNLYGVRQGYRLQNRTAKWLARLLSLESMLIAGALSISLGIAILAAVFWQWSEREFTATYSVFPAVLGTLCLSLGFQNALGGFLLAIVGGNEARFLDTLATEDWPVSGEPLVVAS